MSLDVNYLPSNYIDLTIGDFSCGIDKEITEKLIKEIKTKGNGYTPALGLPSLKRKIISIYQEKYKLFNINEENVQITVSCLHGAFLSLKSLIRSRDDEIILISPYFPPYINLIAGVGAKAVIVNSSAPNFSLPIFQILNSINNRTRAIIINYPNNPTGVGLSPKERKFLNNLSISNNIFIIDDHVYSNYPSTHPYTPVSKDVSHQILVSSFSKNFAMPGIRLGYVIAPSRIINKNAFYNDAITFCPPTLSQYIGNIVLQEPQLFSQHIEKISNKGLLIAKMFNSSKIFKNCSYKGGLYLFIEIPNDISDIELFYKLLEKRFHVLVVKGSEFGYSKRFFRISLSGNYKKLIDGSNKIISCANYVLKTSPFHKSI